MCKGAFCPGGLCVWEAFVPRGVWGAFVQGLFPGGFCPTFSQDVGMQAFSITLHCVLILLVTCIQCSLMPGMLKLSKPVLFAFKIQHKTEIM